MLRYLLSFILVFTLSASLHASVAKITSLSGTATIERGAKSFSAALGSDLESKDTIVTSTTSKAQLTFKDNTIITVGKQSRFSIEEYLFDTADSSNAKFNVISGTVRAMSGKIGKIAPEKFTVKTKTATIGIRGTDFVVHVADDGTISIFCLQGSIIVRDSNGHNVIIDAGAYITITPKGDISGPQEFTSSELNKLLESGFFIPYTLKTQEKVDFDAVSNPILAAEGTNEILHPDESLEKGNIPNIEEVLADAGITITTDSLLDTTPTPTADLTPKTYTGYMTSLFKYDFYNYIKEGTLTLTSDPSTQTVTGDIQVPAIYSTIHLGSTNSYTDINTFETQLTSIEDSYSNISPFPSGSTLKTCACSSEDYFAWGEWEKVQDPVDPTDYKVHGYWIAGVETPISVLDTYRNNSQSFTYTGNTIAEVNTIDTNGVLLGIGSFYGTSQINVDFGSDSFTALFNFTNGSDTYNVNFNYGTVSSNTLFSYSLDTLNSVTHGNLMGQTPSGHLQGAFYGSTGKTVGGTYNVSSNLPVGTDSIIIQGAFKATAP